jgi:hypothetical protein
VAVSGAGGVVWLWAGRRRCRAAGRPHDAAGADGGGPRRGGATGEGRRSGARQGLAATAADERLARVGSTERERKTENRGIDAVFNV